MEDISSNPEVLEVLLNESKLTTERLTKLESAIADLRVLLVERSAALAAQEENQRRILAVIEKHNGRIGSLEQSVASLKAWILIVGGLTGIASFLAIVLK